jgi:hypothetical protein
VIYNDLILVYYRWSPGPVTRIDGMGSHRVDQMANEAAGCVVSLEARHSWYMRYDREHVKKLHGVCIRLHSVFVCIPGTHVKQRVDQSGGQTPFSNLLGVWCSILFISLYSDPGDYSKSNAMGGTYRLTLANRAHLAIATSVAHSDFTLLGRSGFHSAPAYYMHVGTDALHSRYQWRRYHRTQSARLR